MTGHARPSRVRHRRIKVFRGEWAWKPFIYTWVFQTDQPWMFRTLFFGLLRVQWSNPEWPR